jgi:radical SAM superfamily enzyme YgiQ (UPF0313 family)
MDLKQVKEARQRLYKETGTIIKEWGGKLPFALIYPNSYYVGMSNLGIHAIYSLLNGYDDVVCERVFCEKEKKAPSALESQRPLTDFAILAFSISYELDYFKIVPILRAAGIPTYATDRDESHPLVIAGGPCIIANPMPLAPFFDCLCIGEAESILPAMLPVLTEGVKGNRYDMLQALANIPGVYVPQYHAGNPVYRQWVKDLNAFPVHSIILTPDTELGDLYLIEIQRGCHWGCRFCLVSNAFRPARFHSLDSLIAQVETGLKYRKRLGLVGPAVSDYPQFEELLTKIKETGGEISVSSLRVKPLYSITLRELARGGTRTVALAPEAGSQRLRDVIRKGITEDDILEAVNKVAEEGIRQVKLYFMVGLPTETVRDVEEIADLTLKCKTIIDRRRMGSRITLSVNPFMPKAGTPYQWLPMEQLSTINHRLSLLKSRLTFKGIKIKTESPAWSEVQTVLSRGDIRIAEVLANIEELSLSGWRKAVAKCQLDIDYYAHQNWDISHKLPWSFLDIGINPERLRHELKRALAEGS